MAVAGSGVDPFPACPQSVGCLLLEPAGVSEHAAGRGVVAEELGPVLLGRQAQADGLAGQPDLGVSGQAVPDRLDVEHLVG